LAVPPSRGSLLCVVPYHANTGFAWNYIESLYAGVADAFAADGIDTHVAYLSVDSFPKPLEGSSAKPLVLDATLKSWASVRATMREIRRLGITTIYFTDFGWWHWSLPLLRAAGVRRIVAHDHTSGARTVPHGLKRAAKWIKARIPFMSADVIVTVSGYVAKRHWEVGLVPRDMVIPLLNGLHIPELAPPGPPPLAEMHGRPVVLCVCRAAPEKGVDHLLHAFDAVISSWPANEARPLLVYVGNGPQFAELEKLRRSLPAMADIIFVGYRDDVPRFIQSATLCVVPSVWQDACPLGVLEPMSYGKAVVASAVGGVPEQINAPDVGALVPPGDRNALAAAITTLLRDSNRREQIGAAARERIRSHFNWSRQVQTLISIVRGTN
jgi:glycosyltransferase involved in cell wall biosynthesis